MLYLLTYADMASVSPENWTPWKATLLRSLYEKAHATLLAEGMALPEHARSLEARREPLRTQESNLADFIADAMRARLDADVALVGGNLSLEQGRTLVTVAALSGGPFFASDHLAALEPERLALLVNPRVLELVGARPAAPDWEPTERDRASSIWRRDGVVGVFNWGGQDREVVVSVNGRRRARDPWQDRDLGIVEGEIRLQVPAAGARLVALAEA